MKAILNGQITLEDFATIELSLHQPVFPTIQVIRPQPSPPCTPFWVLYLKTRTKSQVNIFYSNPQDILALGQEIVTLAQNIIDKEVSHECSEISPSDAAAG